MLRPKISLFCRKCKHVRTFFWARTENVAPPVGDLHVYACIGCRHEIKYRVAVMFRMPFVGEV